MFRSTAARAGEKRVSIEARLRALGHLLDRRGYTSQGLCLLEVEDSFVINGLKLPDRGQSYGLVDGGETITADEIMRTITQLGTRSWS